MNAVTGVVLAGEAKTGALCSDHWMQLKAEPGLTFFRIKRNAKRCTLCVAAKVAK